MAVKKLPHSDEERIRILQAIIDKEEVHQDDAVLSVRTLHEMRNLLLTFEGSSFCFTQALDDETKAEKKYIDLFKTAQLYISHFIQVLNLAMIRGEIKTESLFYYGLENNNELTVPDLTTEEAILEWGEKIINGETERTRQGGSPMYNPPIAKVKVHYDLFKEALYSLSIYRKNTIRNEENLSISREKVNELIWDTWCAVEDKYYDLPQEERKAKYAEYRICFYIQAGEQLSVFG
jgi:hypothetical protein